MAVIKEPSEGALAAFQVIDLLIGHAHGAQRHAQVEGDIELVGFANCGGCPGKRAGSRARLLQARGAEAVFMASCIGKGLPLNFPCPHAEKMKELIEKSVPGVKVFDYTH